MNKKDVLGLRLLLWSAEKMESIPHGFPVPEMLKIQHSTMRERREVLAVSGIWYRLKQKLKSFNYFSRKLNLQIDCIFVFDCVCNHFVTIVTLLQPFHFCNLFITIKPNFAICLYNVPACVHTHTRPGAHPGTLICSRARDQSFLENSG